MTTSRWYNPYCDRTEYPLLWIHESREYAEKDLGESVMEFRLTYQGPLYADRGEDDRRQSRLLHKHSIRRHFHKQLCELWDVDSRLKPFATRPSPIHESDVEKLSKLFERGGIRWMPLVTEQLGAACSLNILFLRHEPKGGIVQSGDLDNRITTLFNALRVPSAQEIPDDIGVQNEPNPFFCLLSDDKLITEFRVTADRLLVPSEKPDSDVHLVIEVRTFITDHQRAMFVLGGHIHA